MYADYDLDFDREYLDRVDAAISAGRSAAREPFEAETHEHQRTSAFFALVLYFGGSIAVIAALMMWLSPVTFGSLTGSILALVSGIGNLLHDIGILVGVH